MIYQKLLEFQKKNITIKKDATNPHFRSSYSSLNEVLDKVKGPLNDLGIVIVQRPGTDYYINDELKNSSIISGLYTELIDVEDDSKVESFTPFISATDMQKLGGAITYARRYSLVTLLGLEDEDDDGNTASAPKVAPKVAQHPTGPVQCDDEPFPTASVSDDLSLEALNY